jgi:hypothetical protein
MPSAEVRARREAVVREHMESENVRDFDPHVTRVPRSPVLARYAGRVRQRGQPEGETFN